MKNLKLNSAFILLALVVFACQPAANTSEADAAEALFQHGDIEPVCDFIEANHMAVYSNRDYPEFKELEQFCRGRGRG